MAAPAADSVAPPARYGRIRALLHWILALAVLMMLAAGLLLVARTPDDAPEKVAMVGTHMVIGSGIFVLLLFTIPMAFRGRDPAPLSTGNSALDRLARLVHHGLRLSAVLMVLSGIATALIAGLPAVAFEGTADRIPAITKTLPSFKAHATLAWVVVGLVTLHIAGALFHAVIKRDGIFRRMSVWK